MRPAWFWGSFFPVSLAPFGARAPAAESWDVPAFEPEAAALWAPLEPHAATKPVCATRVTAIIRRNVIIWCGVGLLVDSARNFGRLHARAKGISDAIP